MDNSNRRPGMLASSLLVLVLPALVGAWDGPTAAPPGNNVYAPINIGGSEQFKPGVIGANILNIYGASQYLNFGNTTGATGFGLRNNGGALEFKGSGGAWGAVTILGSSNEQLRLRAAAGGGNGLSLFDGGGNAAARGWGFVTNAIAWGDFHIREATGQGANPLTGDSRLTILSGGNTGIGTTEPRERLEVVGGRVRIGSTPNPTWGDLIAGQLNTETVYAYNKICAVNSWGNCEGTGGVVLSSTGVKFPDGTVQTTAAGGGSAGCAAGTINWTASGTTCSTSVSASVHAQLRQVTDSTPAWGSTSASDGNGTALTQCLNGVWQPAMSATCGYYVPYDPGGGLY